jgi:hypothetical protein
MDAANRAALASFGDVQLGNALLNTRYGQQQGQIGRNMQGSASVLGLEMEAAKNKGNSLMGIGSLLNAGGQLAGMGAGMGWGAPPPPVVPPVPTYTPGQGMPPWRVTTPQPQTNWFAPLVAPKK